MGSLFVFTYEKMWLETTVPLVSPAVWHEGITPAYRAEVLEDMRNSQFCVESRNDYLNYDYGRRGQQWVYTDFTCRPPRPTSIALKSPSSLFVPTHIEETFIETSSPDVDFAVCSQACKNLPNASLGRKTSSPFEA